MKPISVSVRVDRPREDVFAFLDVLADHAQFTDHMLVDWSFDGPAAGSQYLEAPPSERLAMPLIRAYLKRANAKTMRRLGETLARSDA
jgi:hypothetical protein